MLLINNHPIRIFSTLEKKNGDPIDCCNGFTEDPEYCFPLTIQKGDLGRQSTCLNFVRSW